MSKFLKVIVNLFLVCAILVAGALLVPPLVGVSTTIVDSASMDTNLPIGSVTYSQDVKVADIAIGDKILVETDAKVYAYVVESADAGAGNYIVTDPKNSQADPEEVTLRNMALKIMLTIPFIGYIMIAMRSVEGLIIIGLVVLFVIILFILSELWKKTEDDEWDEDSEDDDEESESEEVEDEEFETPIPHESDVYAELTEEFSSAELARSIAEIQSNEKNDAEMETETSERSVWENQQTDKTGVSEDWNLEDLFAIEETAESLEETEVPEQAAEMPEETLETTESEVAEVVDTASPGEFFRADIAEAAEGILETEILETVADTEDTSEEDTDSFIPVSRPEKDEILKKAEAEGDHPEVIEYKEFGITIIDFSEDL